MSKNKNSTNKNNIFKKPIDCSGYKFTNPFLFPLHHSKNNKFLKLNISPSSNFNYNNDISDNKQINIKNNNLLFSMRFNSILDTLRQNRDNNEETLKDKYFDRIADSLDKTQLNQDEKKDIINDNLRLVPYRQRHKFKHEFNKVLKNIDDKFNLLYNNDISNAIIKSTINKNTIGTQYSDPTKPPPPPSHLFTSKNDILNPLITRNRCNSWGNSNNWNNQAWGNQNQRNVSWNFKPQPPSFSRPPGFDFNFQNPQLKYPPIPESKIPPTIQIKKEKVTIEREINGLNDILKLIKDYPIKVDVEYNINMQAMHNIKEPLNELNNMIGMNKLKDSIVDQIIFFSQNLHKDNDFMHTVIYGPPGTGKTEIAKIMGKIFSSIGILKNNKFRKATRADLIAGYLGQTAIKTRDIIKDCLGGVLFIDEAYALGNPEKRDSFAKECIDTLCEGLSDNKDKLMVIIAGYEEDLDKCFFAYNQGLNSRFPWRFHTDDYKGEELNKIFVKKVNDIGWKLKKDIKNSWFEDKMEYFKFYGRDIETLLAKTKIAHGRRVFCKKEDEKRILTQKDIDKGFEMFIDNKEVKSRGDKSSIIPFMYS